MIATAKLAQPPIRKTDAWRHQCEAYHFAMQRPATLLDMGMGTGKSKVAADVLANAGSQRTLVLCPKSVLGVWRRELARHCAIEPESVVLDNGTCSVKAKRLAAALHRTPLAVIVNYESAWREPLGTLLLAQRWDTVIGDELHRVKAPGGKASHWICKLQTGRKLGLTGTPMPHSPLDLYSQYRFLDRRIFGTSFVRFRARYAITHREFPSKVLQWINQDELYERFRRIAYSCTTDVLDLPEVMHDERSFVLCPKARRAYSQMERDLVADVKDGTVTAANALVRGLRLQQITSGYLTDGETIHEEVDTGKKELLTDLLQDTDEPVVVFCRFRRDLNNVRDVAQILGRVYGELSGARRDLTEHAEMPEGIDVMGVQIQSGGVGVDLTRAAVGVYYSLGFSLGDYEQSLARIHRPGQTRPVRYYHLIAESTIDQQVYCALRDRKQVIEELLAWAIHSN